MKNLRRKLSFLSWFLFLFLACVLLSWCWWDDNWSGGFSLNVYWFYLNYGWGNGLERVALKTDDLDDIIDLYQEPWDNSDFKDSLLIAEKYSELWVNAFSQSNLDNLKEQWLTLSNIKRTQIWLKKYWKDINAVLVEYDIDEWFINEIPVLFVSQLFIPNGNNIVLMSFVTENKSSRSGASNMFKNIR